MNEQESTTCCCPDVDCSRHGVCSECQAYHITQGTLTKCRRENKTTNDTDALIDTTARRILEQYREAFVELAKGPPESR